MKFSTATLVAVAQQILIYGGIAMIIIGMFGSSMVILIFARRPLNQNPCSTYIIANAILSFLFLPLYYLPNIVTFGLQINWLSINTPFCKFQMSYASFTITSILVLNCFISFDRYAVSSQSVHTRSFSSKRNARLLVVIGLTLVLCLISTPVAILFENVPSSPDGPSYCTSRNSIFLLFAAFVFYPIIEGVLPVALAIYFLQITRRHVRNLNNQEFVRRFDKQITRMLLFQIITNAVASFPFAVVNLYRALTSLAVRTPDQANIVQFFRVMAIWLFYIPYCSDFYIYILTSHDTRAQTTELICFWRRCRIRRVNPIETRAITFTKKDNVIKTKVVVATKH